MASLTQKIQEACECAKRDGRELIICVLDEGNQGLKVISSMEKMTHIDIMRSLQVITETYLEDENGRQESNLHIVN